MGVVVVVVSGTPHPIQECPPGVASKLVVVGRRLMTTGPPGSKGRSWTASTRFAACAWGAICSLAHLRCCAARFIQPFNAHASRHPPPPTCTTTTTTTRTHPPTAAQAQRPDPGRGEARANVQGAGRPQRRGVHRRRSDTEQHPRRAVDAAGAPMQPARTRAWTRPFDGAEAAAGDVDDMLFLSLSLPNCLHCVLHAALHIHAWSKLHVKTSSFDNCARVCVCVQ